MKNEILYTLSLFKQPQVAYVLVALVVFLLLAAVFA